MKPIEKVAKSILVKSKLPDTDYVVNPYVGCQFACMYCYASFMGRFVGEAIEEWGNYLHIKTNSVELFRSEFSRLKKRGGIPTILLSSVTDPYQGCEKKFRLTRGILEILAEDKYTGVISILTKSPMVLRDIDLFHKLPNIEIGLTVTSTDDHMSRFLEIAAPSVSRRFDTLEKLNSEGIKTYAFLGPLMPHFRYMPEKLDLLISKIKKAGTSSVYVEHMNLKHYILKRLSPYLDKYGSEVKKLYENAKSEEHRNALTEIIMQLLGKYELQLRLNEVIRHDVLKKKIEDII